MTTREALLLLLDHVDWTHKEGCLPTNMVGAVLPREVIEQARKALEETKDVQTKEKNDEH